jgi:hypothetical protein
LNIALATLRARPRRFLVALFSAGIFLWVGTFILREIDATPLLACGLAVVLGVGVLMQTLSPGSGIRTLTRPQSTDAREQQGIATVDSDPPPPLEADSYLSGRVDQLIAAAERDGSWFALVLLEAVAEPGMSPELLSATAEDRLYRAVRRQDTVARVGPRSFAVAISLTRSHAGERGGTQGSEGLREALIAGARLVNATTRGSGDGPVIEVSLGVAMYEPGLDLFGLMTQAAQALKRSALQGHVGVFPRRFSRSPRPFGASDPTGERPPKGS